MRTTLRHLASWVAAALAAVTLLAPAVATRTVSQLTGVVPAPAAQLLDAAHMTWRPDPYTSGARFTSCTVTYRIDASAAAYAGDVRAGIARFAELTGLTLVEASGDATIVITGEAHLAVDGRPAIALTEPVAEWRNGAAVITSAVFQLNTSVLAVMTPGFDGAAPRAWTVVHELGHAAGIDHSSDAASVMFGVNHGQDHPTGADEAVFAAVGAHC